MFKHENIIDKKCVSEMSEDDADKKNKANEDININNVTEANINNVVTAEDECEILDVDKEDEIKDYESDFSNSTFGNPSHGGEVFMCDICDFASAMKEIIENHNKLIHNWCSKCFSSFRSQNELKCHLKEVHCDK
jgi:hypothetical protein